MSEPAEDMDTSENGAPETQDFKLPLVLEILSPINENYYDLGAKLDINSQILHTIEKMATSKEEPHAAKMKEVILAWAGSENAEISKFVNAVRVFEEGMADKLQEIVADLSPEDLLKQPKIINQSNNQPSEQHEESESSQSPDQQGDQSDEIVPTEAPDIDTQKKELQAVLKQGLKKGDTWFLVDIRWIKQWKKFVGFDAWDQSSAGKESANPGPVDNANLFKDDMLREHLMDELDYFLLPESAWRKLASWYGLTTGSKVIPRRVVEYGLYMKHCKVEVYLLEFKLSVHPNVNDVKKKDFSRADTVAELEAEIRKEFEIPKDTICRVWHRYMTHTYELLSKRDQSLQDAGLYNGQTIVLEKQNSDGSWPRTTSTVSSTQHTTRSSDDAFGTVGVSTRSSSSYSSYSWSSSTYSQKPDHPGLCGLSNLGNTCFMNSALQCLSNTAPLSEYFIGTEAGYKPYKKHLNTDNPLGMGGAIAEAYGALLEEIWGGKVNVTAPRHFKTQVGRYAPQFVGYAQHDSQELLAFLLDGLHEDLNLVKKKPYVDMTIKTEGREEKEIAEETWYKYLQRNQSVIVKLFQGQLRSTLVCPKCQQESKTFDPFMFLSLPLPVKKSRTLSVFLVRANPMADIEKYKLKLPKRGCVADLKKELGTLSGVEGSHLAVVDVYNSRFHRIYTDRDPLTHIMDKDDIYCYELLAENTKRKMAHVPVYMRVMTERQYSYQQYSRYYSLFGLPTVVYVPAECTYRTLYSTIVSKMRRYVKLWSEAKSQDNEPDKNNDNNNTVEPMDNENNGNDQDEAADTQTPDNQNENQESETRNGDSEHGNGDSEPGNGDSEPGKEGSAEPEQSMETDEPEEKKDFGERDLFKLMVVNSYGSQEIKKLADDPKRPLSLSGSTYISCDWEEEVKEKCYDEEAACREYKEHESCHDDPVAKGKNIQLMDCFELFTVKETLGKEDEWYCPQCKEHVQASKKFDLWNLPEILVVHLKRFSYDRYWRDKLDVLVEFPVNALDLSSKVLSPDSADAIYDLYAVSNHFGGMGGGHYTAYAKNKETDKWYNFDDSHVSETVEDRLVSSAAYVLFYRRRGDQNRPTARRSILDRSLSQSFADDNLQLKAKYAEKGSDVDQDSREVFDESAEDNLNNDNPAQLSTDMNEPD